MSLGSMMLVNAERKQASDVVRKAAQIFAPASCKPAAKKPRRPTPTAADTIPSIPTRGLGDKLKTLTIHQKHALDLSPHSIPPAEQQSQAYLHSHAHSNEAHDQ